ncbi:1990_t:CDS:2 [Ambispora gerdemannii]|uniref:1990_t:CDS:1 n=1 Tax=Ambispora gerdemannii TaxID=144530 RepID=A0A9N8YKG1_9GLOM|nr:1990_t:CDS:2 [Ambispora gerdemannii]
MSILFLPFSLFSGEFLEKIPKLREVAVQLLEVVHVSSRPVPRALVARRPWHIKKEHQRYCIESGSNNNILFKVIESTQFYIAKKKPRNCRRYHSGVHVLNCRYSRIVFGYHQIIIDDDDNVIENDDGTYLPGCTRQRISNVCFFVKVEPVFGEFLKIGYLETSTSKRPPTKPSRIPIRVWNYSHPRRNAQTVRPIEINNKRTNTKENNKKKDRDRDKKVNLSKELIKKRRWCVVSGFEPHRQRQQNDRISIHSKNRFRKCSACDHLEFRHLKGI